MVENIAEASNNVRATDEKDGQHFEARDRTLGGTLCDQFHVGVGVGVFFSSFLHS